MTPACVMTRTITVRVPRSVCPCCFPVVFLSFRVTEAYTVTTNLILRVNIRTTTTTTTAAAQQYVVKPTADTRRVGARSLEIELD